MANSSISSDDGGGRSNDGTLLVNFPLHCRLSSSDSSCKEEEEEAELSTATANNNNNNNKPVSVRFAEKGLVTFIDLPDHAERRERWFSEDDNDTFKRRLLQERHRISRKLTTTPIDNDDLIMCIGMEKLLTPKLSRLVKQRQLDHLHSILAEQKRQEVENIIDEEAIACLSQQNSEWTRRRSHKLATAYWNNLKVNDEDDGDRDDQRRSST